ncbi:uncharacterized protein [Temnothorax nylanderi]|uniref:uncharacterized protein n=1 Tax=Temnothorax nylanderi TaxID=102681 RepID=UPI003A867A59
MSEMTSAVETQQQQYVGSSSNAEYHCKDCRLTLDSEKSLEVHLRYHHENLLKWGNKTQQEESNNNNKTGNHNSHVSANSDSVPADSSEPSSMSPSQDPTSSQQQAQQQQQSSQQQQQPQPAIHTVLCPPYDQFRSMYNDSSYMQNYVQNDQTYIMSHTYSPSQEDGQSNGGRDGYPRYNPYQQLFPSDRATSNSTSPHSPPFQCDKCGVVYEDANQLSEHMRTSHLNSPTAYPSAPQYQQLGNSPQQQGQQLHPSPPLSNQPQAGYDYNGQTIKSEMKQEQPEEQAEILDLDSHKVQTHRYEEEIMRLQQQQQHQHQHQQHQGLQMQMHHQQVMQQQSLPDQYMRGQHMPVEHGHQGSPIITSTQPMSGHQMPTGFVQQTSKAPLANQSWKSNEPRRPKTYNCTACNKWFTSSGHLKRHYNTTLHKNAVKNGKEPDPATLPITAHHHPTRENNAGHSTSGRGGGAPARSPPELSSRSPPNLMAGPSGEATGGLLHTPTTLCNNSNSSNSSNESLVVLVQQQQQQQQQQPHLVHVGINSPVSPLVGHHQQQMGTAPQQLGLQQQQQQPHLPTGSSGQPVHHSTTSPMPPPVASHMNCPSPMALSSHPVHHMNSPPGSVHPAMTSPTAMEGTTMPHQQYPNALPPHVTVTTNPVAPLSIQAATMQLHTTGNEQDERPQHRSLPDFRTIAPVYTELQLVDQNQIQVFNVGGLKEEIIPQESFESSVSTYDLYQSMRYKTLTDEMMTLQINPNGMVQGQEYLCQNLQKINIEYNNNIVYVGQAKEDLDPNVGEPVKKQPVKKSKGTTNKRKVVQVRTTNARFISKDGCHMCIDCNKAFTKPCYLTQHNKSFHCGDKPVKCTQCGKRFSNNEQHDKHQGMHSQARKHKCEECPKVFAHKTDLKRHNCVHTGDRPFTCETCGKGFIRQDHMKKHQETHKRKMQMNANRNAAQRYREMHTNARQPSNLQQSTESTFNIQFNDSCLNNNNL